MHAKNAYQMVIDSRNKSAKEECENLKCLIHQAARGGHFFIVIDEKCIHPNIKHIIFDQLIVDGYGVKPNGNSVVIDWSNPAK